MPIIQSLLDNDLYKFTMQRAVLRFYPRTTVEYVFNDRRPDGKFNQSFADQFSEELKGMAGLRLQEAEINWMKVQMPWIGEEYIQYLANYQFDPAEVQWDVREGKLDLRVKGLWDRTILWEVPLMALISELYFKYCDLDWKFDEDELIKSFQQKGQRLQAISAPFTDFGTRRRRSFRTQELAIQSFVPYSNFAGTSNVHLAMKYGERALGTMAHEWIMGISALESLRYSNRFAMKRWMQVYKGRLGTALPDTFGSQAFFNDFDDISARLFDSVRHDSGSPLEFADTVIETYRRLGIDPLSKAIIFSDGLDVSACEEIANYLRGRILFSFGIGTHFTNDFANSKPLNMVIKLATCNGVDVVKLSDSPGKAIGTPDAIRVAKWTFFKEPLG